jgi:hypothetical protein
MVVKRQSKKAIARVEQRNRLWPKSEDQHWPREGEDGWAKIPRSISLILAIINQKTLSDGVDLTSTYLALLSHNMGDGMVEIDDDQEMAAMCGLMKKTWALRIRALEKLGMISVAPKLTRPIGYVLVRHPMSAIYALRAAGNVPDEMWHALKQRNTEMGATLCPEEEDEELERIAEQAVAEHEAEELEAALRGAAERKKEEAAAKQAAEGGKAEERLTGGGRRKLHVG